MREIKFRAWDASEEELVDYAHLRYDPDDWLIDLLDGDADEGDVLMQYTGLKDKNGVDIYEGDIVKGKSNNYSIEFQQSGGWVTNNNLPLWAFHEPEVIGNIYENKDLLK